MTKRCGRAIQRLQGLLHYQNRLKKAVRLVKFPKIEKFRRKIEKYRAIRDAAAPRKGRNNFGKTSRFIGVSWDEPTRKWRACVKVNKRNKNIGLYDDEEVAARKYNEYVRGHDLGNHLNDVDANGKPLPTTVKHTSRFWGVSWFLRTSRWLVRYDDDSKPRRKKCYVGYFDDEERAALAYNEAVIAADLDHIRPMNRVDASGRPLPKDQD